jgi:hypothetical protein
MAAMRPDLLFLLRPAARRFLLLQGLPDRIVPLAFEFQDIWLWAGSGFWFSTWLFCFHILGES